MQGFAAQQPEHDTGIVDDHTLVPAGRLHTLQDLAYAVIEVTDRNITPDKIANPERVNALPFPRQAVGEPICFAGNVIKDLGKSQTFEPSRSPGAKVSLRVVAIDDDRPVLLQRCGGLAIELGQRDIHRPGQVFCLIFFLREDLDKLRRIFHHSTYLFALDLRWHIFPPFLGYTAEPDKETESKIYASSYFYNYTEDGRPSALIGIFFAFTFRQLYRCSSGLERQNSK